MSSKQDAPFISNDQRPDLTIDLDKRTGEATLRELRAAILGAGAPRFGEDGVLKLAPDDDARKSGSKDQVDKASADNKAQNDLKVSTDKQASDQSQAPSVDPRRSEQPVVELLQRILRMREGE